jgi:hypothetical protein
VRCCDADFVSIYLKLFLGYLHEVFLTLSGSNLHPLHAFEPVLIALEGGGSHVSQFYNHIVVFLADGLDYGVDEG